MDSSTTLKRIEHLIGRCFDIEEKGLSDNWGASHCTVVSCFEQRHLSVHLDNGSIDTRVPLEMFWKAYVNGLIQESRSMAPFTNPPHPRSKHWDSIGISTRGGVRRHADVLRGTR